MKTTHRCLAIAVIALMTQAFGTAAANAADATANPPRRTVGYKDLDLTSAADAKALYVRIRSAAKVVCAQLDGRQLVQHAKASRCEVEAIERAVKKVDEPLLTQHYLTIHPESDLNPTRAVKR